MHWLKNNCQAKSEVSKMLNSQTQICTVRRLSKNAKFDLFAMTKRQLAVSKPVLRLQAPSFSAFIIYVLRTSAAR